jgi:hypothetical protein
VTFGDGVLVHLDAQLVSARRLLELVLKQAGCIRERDAEGVLARLAEIQGEMERRGGLERQRAQLLQHAAVHANVPAHEIDLELLTTLVEPHTAAAARQKSAELRGLLAEIAREHLVNRALMRQELAFLDHLMRELGAEPDTGYGDLSLRSAPAPGRTTQASFRTLDLQA